MIKTKADTLTKKQNGASNSNAKHLFGSIVSNMKNF